ncbi:hypothetical protein BDP27DRAFT_1428339 [Rhodocollybia butyracea]|uniref:Uncharacterized protein n=1 Tax=Rhodocollybia butyracea TaxID=206335 RepID=A0A9P5PG37_9AGAR|nr:hypothetical protein BDP27DRAFT_1428339 [Rhodocollybia butyracea]
MQHAYRWKTFKYAGPQLECKTLSPLHFPLLSKAGIGRAVTSSDLDCFEHSPRLCTFSSRTIPRSNILCNQIEHLKLHGRLRSLAGLAKVFRSCPSLKSLEATDIQTYGAGLEQGTLGTWRNITSLAFADCSLQNMFSSFNFPSLNKLVIEDHLHCTVWPVDALISFISRSSCVITSLTLHMQSLSDSDLIACLQVMPELLHLDIANSCYQEHNSITSHLLSSLTQQQSTSISLVPKLHSLSLHNEIADFNDHAFIRMVESRWFKPGSDVSTAMSTMGRACIHSVVLKCERREVDAEIYEPLWILDAEGLRVVVSGTNGVQV